MKTLQNYDAEIEKEIADRMDEFANSGWLLDIYYRATEQRNDLHGHLQHTLYLLRNIIGLPSLETYAHYPQFQAAREWLEEMADE